MRAGRGRSGWALRLGLRLLVAGGARRRWSMALVVVGVGVVVIGALSCAAAATVVHSQATRTQARGLTYTDDLAQAQGWATVWRFPYDDRMVLRVDIDAQAGLPTPPGLRSWPGPGEMVVSPAAANALREDSDFARVFPGTVVGRVGDEGLRTPDELVVYRGVPRADQFPGGYAVVDQSRGGPPDLDTTDIPSDQVAALVGLLVLVTGLPSVAFLTVAARLSAATRARRLTALRLLGAPPRLVRRVNAVEIVVLAVLGWGLGVAAFPGVNVALARSHVLGTTWFAEDTALTVPQALLLLGATLVFAAAVSLRTDIGTGLTRVTVRSARRGRASLWRLVPLLLGATSLVAQVVAGGRRPEGTFVANLGWIMMAAVLVTAGGLVLAIPALVRWLGDLLAAHGPNLAARLGGARAAFDPSGGAGLVTALALVVLATGVMIGPSRAAQAVSVPVTPVVPVTVMASEIPVGSAHALSEAVGAPMIAIVQQPTMPGDARRPRTVVVAPCDTLRSYLAVGSVGQPLTWCADGTTYITASARAGGLSAPDVQTLVPAASGPAAELPAAVADVAEDIVQGGFDALVTVDSLAVVDAVPLGPTHGVNGATIYRDSVFVLVAATPRSVDHAITGIISVAPYSQPMALGLDPDSGAHFALIMGFIHLGLALAALVTLVALATALTDRATQRRSADVELLLVGVDGGVLRGAHRWEVLVTAASAAAVALICGVLGGIAWQYAGGLLGDPDWGAIGGLSLATALACALTVAVASGAVPRALDLAATRRE